MPDNIRFDIDRDVRISLPEAVFCEGKSHDALLSLLKRFASDDEKPILFTRLSESVWARVPEDLRAAYDYDPLSRTAWHRTCPRHETGLASIVSAGTADAFVTHEVARTLEYLGWTVRLFEDCGVAGLWRIQAARDDINKGDVVVVCAGLDAALASVMGGLTSARLRGPHVRGLRHRRRRPRCALELPCVLRARRCRHEHRQRLRRRLRRRPRPLPA